MASDKILPGGIWTRQEMLLITEVKRHPPLYEKDGFNKYGNDLYDMSWAEVSIETGLSVDMCEKKWLKIEKNYFKTLNTLNEADDTPSFSKYLDGTLDFLKSKMESYMSAVDPIVPRRALRSNSDLGRKVSESESDSGSEINFRCKETFKDELSNSSDDIIISDLLKQRNKRIEKEKVKIENIFSLRPTDQESKIIASYKPLNSNEINKKSTESKESDPLACKLISTRNDAVESSIINNNDGSDEQKPNHINNIISESTQVNSVNIKDKIIETKTLSGSNEKVLLDAGSCMPKTISDDAANDLFRSMIFKQVVSLKRRKDPLNRVTSKQSDTPKKQRKIDNSKQVDRLQKQRKIDNCKRVGTPQKQKKQESSKQVGASQERRKRDSSKKVCTPKNQKNLEHVRSLQKKEDLIPMVSKMIPNNASVKYCMTAIRTLSLPEVRQYRPSKNLTSQKPKQITKNLQMDETKTYVKNIKPTVVDTQDMIQSLLLSETQEDCGNIVTGPTKTLNNLKNVKPPNIATPEIIHSSLLRKTQENANIVAKPTKLSNDLKNIKPNNVVTQDIVKSLLLKKSHESGDATLPPMVLVSKKLDTTSVSVTPYIVLDYSDKAENPVFSETSISVDNTIVTSTDNSITQKKMTTINVNDANNDTSILVGDGDKEMSCANTPSQCHNGVMNTYYNEKNPHKKYLSILDINTEESNMNIFFDELTEYLSNTYALEKQIEIRTKICDLVTTAELEILDPKNKT